MNALPRRIVLAFVGLAVLAMPQTAQAQAPRFLNVLGYGAAGGALGALATSGADCSGSGFICIPAGLVVGTLGGTMVGMVAGGAVASSANRAVEEGRSPSSAALGAITVGATLGGAALGLVAGGFLVNNEGSTTFLGDDEQTFLITGLAGAAFGIFQVARRWEAMTGHTVAVRPTVGADGRTGLNLQVRF